MADDAPAVVYRYRQEVLDELAAYGVFPRAWTPPARVHEFLSDLYRYEIRQLKHRLLRREFPLHDYARRVVELRKRYPVISLPPGLWTV